MAETPPFPTEFEPGHGFARKLDAGDTLAGYRDLFFLPHQADGKPIIYLCGHSLGLQPKAVRPFLEQELLDWAQLGVEGHFKGRTPWYSYHELFRESARLVGALPGEVVLMNSLTINLHLMMVTFYKPTSSRYKIITDEPVFPSDLYALQSQIRHHGFDPDTALVIVRPREGERTLRESDIEKLLEERGEEIALVLWNGVNFFTGQWFDLARLTRAARKQGCVVGLDLAHAAGNVPLHLHDWEVDFAIWCCYKYLNGGPGAVGGCFIHERHGQNPSLARFAGWWGNDPRTRFQMSLQPTFVPQPGADGWQVSNPPILAMAPLRASLALFDRAGMPALRAKSEALTAYLLYLLDQRSPGGFEVVTPRERERRGSQISLLCRSEPREVLRKLTAAGVLADFREPDVIRVAPVPLYNRFADVWAFVEALGHVGG